MATPSLTLWISTNENQLLTGWKSRATATTPVFKQGDNVGVEIHLTNCFDGVNTSEVPFNTSTIKVAIGGIDVLPTAGTWKLSWNNQAIGEFALDATILTIQTAINANTEISALGGVTVTKPDKNTFRITWNEKFVVPYQFETDAESLIPDATIVISNIRIGSATQKQVSNIKIKQNAVSYQSTWATQSPAIVTATIIQANSTRVEISPKPKEGTFVIYKDGVGTKALSVTSSADEVSSALGDAFVVTKSGDYAWDVSQTDGLTTQVVTADGSGIISFDSKFGYLNFNNYAVQSLLNGGTSVSTTLEVQITDGTNISTILQTSCTIIAELIGSLVYEPIPYDDPATQSELISYVTGYAYPLNSNPAGYITASALSVYATKASPTFTGTPLAPTASTSTNTTQIATTAFVKAQAYATLASPTFTGDPKSVTPSTSDNDTSIATTAFVKAQSYITNSVSSSGTTPALTITQTGIGDAFIVNDSSPDTTPFRIDQNGHCGIGVAPDATVCLKVDSTGIKFNDGSVQTSAVSTASFIAKDTEYTSTTYPLSRKLSVNTTLSQINARLFLADYVSTVGFATQGITNTGTSYLIGDSYTSNIITEAIITAQEWYTKDFGGEGNIENTTLKTRNLLNSTGVLLESYSDNTYDQYNQIVTNGALINNLTIGSSKIEFKQDWIDDQGDLRPSKFTINFNGNPYNHSGTQPNTLISYSGGAGEDSFGLSTNGVGGIYGDANGWGINSLSTSGHNDETSTNYLLSAQGVFGNRNGQTWSVDPEVGITGIPMPYYPDSNPEGYITADALPNINAYALLAGASFTGKVSVNNGTTSAPFNIATGVAPTTSVAGDIWIATTNLAYKDSTGQQRNTVSTNTGNTFSQPQIISQASGVGNPSLSVIQTGNGGGVKITNTGTGESLRVEDETSPDSTPFVVSNSGRVGIGIAPDATVALTVDATGIKVNGATLIPASAVSNSPITSGNMSHSEYPKELVISINGVNYAIPLRVV